MIDYRRLWAHGICNNCRGYEEDTMPESFPNNFAYALENKLLYANDRDIAITLAYYDESHPTYRQVAEQYELTLERVRQICIKTCRKWRNQQQLLVKGIIAIQRVPANYRGINKFHRDMSLWDIDADTRTRNQLIRVGIKTLGDLIDLSEEELVSKLRSRFGSGIKTIAIAKQLHSFYSNNLN